MSQNRTISDIVVVLSRYRTSIRLLRRNLWKKHLNLPDRGKPSITKTFVKEMTEEAYSIIASFNTPVQEG